MMRLIFLSLCVSALVGCGRSDAPPPLTGNLTDARGAHAGSFRAADAGPGDYGNAAGSIHAMRPATVEHVHKVAVPPK